MGRLGLFVQLSQAKVLNLLTGSKPYHNFKKVPSRVRCNWHCMPTGRIRGGYKCGKGGKMHSLVGGGIMKGTSDEVVGLTRGRRGGIFSSWP